MERFSRSLFIGVGIPLLILFLAASLSFGGNMPKKKAVPKKPKAAKQSFCVTKPANGEKVPQRFTVEGKGAKAGARVWVVILPTHTSTYWVQPAVTVNKDGSWSVEAYFGREGMDMGAPYSVRAVMNPKNDLNEGMQLSGWPEAEAITDAVSVTRQ